MSSDTLALLQQRFWRLITAPCGVASGLEQVARDDGAARPLMRWIDAASEATAEERLDVYANMYFYRLHDVLAEDFPQTRKLIGTDAFHNLVTDYLLAQPSQSPSLRDLGAALPRFLAIPSSTGAASAPAWRVDAADLAQLEWDRVSVFDAADVSPLVEADLAALPAERWAELPLQLTPAARLSQRCHGVAQLWQSLRAREPAAAPAEALPAPQAGPQQLLIWRNGLVVAHRVLDDPEAGALALCAGSGTTFGQICAACLAHDGDVQRAAAQVLDWLRRWMVDGVVCAAPA